MNNEANTAQAESKGKGYNFEIEQLTTANRRENSNGTPKITFRGKLIIRGRETERTVVAQGKAAELITGMVRKGNKLNLRVVFKNAVNEDGSRGGEYLTVIDLPREPEQKAA